ncbi:unnamed protein product [Periconia digitata]|uniref:Uncharacterized protein n=1 Tax=Periconia digitata TaxID=1303443 RepID=A0A9W4XJ29_9PLEO|nr:unnamed protein product [Periconia digitata]
MSIDVERTRKDKTTNAICSILYSPLPIFFFCSIYLFSYFLNHPVFSPTRMHLISIHAPPPSWALLLLRLFSARLLSVAYISCHYSSYLLSFNSTRTQAFRCMPLMSFPFFFLQVNRCIHLSLYPISLYASLLAGIFPMTWLALLVERDSDRQQPQANTVAVIQKPTPVLAPETIAPPLPPRSFVLSLWLPAGGSTTSMDAFSLHKKAHLQVKPPTLDTRRICPAPSTTRTLKREKLASLLTPSIVRIPKLPLLRICELMKKVPPLLNKDLPPCAPALQVAYENVNNKLRALWLQYEGKKSLEELCRMVHQNFVSEKSAHDASKHTVPLVPWRRYLVFQYEIRWAKYFVRESQITEPLTESELDERHAELTLVPKELALFCYRCDTMAKWEAWHQKKRAFTTIVGRRFS